MERLTEKISEYIQCNNNECRLGYCDRECEHYKRMVNKLAEYEDAEEQGLLLRFPCKVGDTVWYVDDDDDNYPLEFLITKIEVEEHKYLRYHAIEKDNYEKIGFIKESIGKTIFLTREKAEKALEQMKAGGEDE